MADTGMSAGGWNANFSMDPGYFHDNLVPGSVLGFYDGRMVAQRGTPLAAGNDPKLAELFAHAELKRVDCAPGPASAVRSADWVTGAQNPQLRGGL